MTVLERCYTRIRRVASMDRQTCVFDVPRLVIGLPLFDCVACTNFLVRNLVGNGYDVVSQSPTSLHISWDLGGENGYRGAFTADIPEIGIGLGGTQNSIPTKTTTTQPRQHLHSGFHPQTPPIQRQHKYSTPTSPSPVFAHANVFPSTLSPTPIHTHSDSLIVGGAAKGGRGRGGRGAARGRGGTMCVTPPRALADFRPSGRFVLG